MKAKNLLIALAILIAGTSMAQSVKITGKVVDSLGVPLAMANVIAYQKDKNLGAFGITNNSGRYQLLDLKKDSTYVVKVSYLGLKTIEDTIKNLQQDLQKTYVMLADDNALDAVNIVYDIPVSIKGDTIVYNSDSFTNGTERKLGEVLQKLPGVEVNEDGEVEVEGQKVEKLMVNGKDFFEGDTKLGTKNIPANAVDKVEVLKNYNNVSQLKGLGNDQDRIAINIRLKEGKENFWFGEGQGAVGYGGQDERYLLQPKAFFYSENFSMNILTDLNNLGEPSFTGRDFNRFVGFRRGNTNAAGASVNIAPRSALSLNAANRSTNIVTRFAALNTSWSLTNNLDIKAFGILTSNDTDARNDSRNIFLTTGLNEFRDTQQEEVSNAAIFKLGADYKPNENLSFDYDGQINISEQRSSSATLSQRTLDNDLDVEDIAANNENNPISYDQSLNAYYTQGDKNVFSLETRFLDQEEDPFFNALRDIREEIDPLPFGEIGLQTSEPYNLNQRELIQTQRIDAKLDYWRVLNKKSNINFLAGTVIADQNYNSNIFQILNTGEVNNLDALTGNRDVNYDYRNYYAGAKYKIVLGKFTLTPGLVFHSVQTRDVQNGITNTINTERVLPEFVARYDLRSSESINFSYLQTISFRDVQDYARGLVLSSFSSLNRGNNQITGVTSDSFNLRYSKFDMFNYQQIFALLRYSRTRDALQQNVEQVGINRVSSILNNPLDNENLTATASYGREIKSIQPNVSANFIYSRSNNIFNGDLTEVNNYIQSYSFRARSNFQKGVNFNFSYVLSINNSNSENSRGTVENNSTTHTFDTTLDWQIGKRWFVRADYDYNLFTATGGIENNFDLLDATIRYQKPESQWEYSLIGTNLLNLDARVSNNFSQILASTNAQFILPRYIYFQVRYDL
ncbi:MAG: carboxypeptidase regulatory-like domain-containing protein [Nonlabens sp.]